MKCPDCKNSFNSKGSLKHHQKTAKYCLSIRGLQNKNYICLECTKQFSSNHNLTVHMVSCGRSKIALKLKSKLEKTENMLEQQVQTIQEQKNTIQEQKNTIQEQKKTIRELQDKLENIAIRAVSRPTTSNKTQINNYIQKLELTTDQHIQDQVPHLTIEHIKQGPKGYAEYALSHPFHNRLICVDYARRKVKYKDDDGKLAVDPEMTKLSKKLFESIKTKNKELIMECINEMPGSIDPAVKMDMMTDFGEYIIFVNRGAEGEKTELFHDFVKRVCSQSIVE